MFGSHKREAKIRRSETTGFMPKIGLSRQSRSRLKEAIGVLKATVFFLTGVCCLSQVKSAMAYRPSTLSFSRWGCCFLASPPRSTLSVLHQDLKSSPFTTRSKEKPVFMESLPVPAESGRPLCRFVVQPCLAARRSLHSSGFHRHAAPKAGGDKDFPSLENKSWLEGPVKTVATLVGVGTTLVALAAAAGGIWIDKFSTVPCQLSPDGCQEIPLFMKGERGGNWSVAAVGWWWWWW